VTDLPPPPPPPPPPASPPPSAPQGGDYPSLRPGSRADLPRAGRNAPASIFQRLIARFLDLFLISLPMQAWAVSAGYLHTADRQTRIDAPTWFLASALVVQVVYEVAFIGWRGQTLGKMALRIRAARYVDGGVPSWQQAAFRSLVPAALQFLALVLPESAGTLEVVLTVALLYVFAAALFDPLLRGLHDKAAGTIVLRTR
jgi:uncharacterized RDD family membrane protein YckC